MTAELPPLLQIIAGLTGLVVSAVAGVTAITKVLDTRANVTLTRAKAKAIIDEAEAKKIVAAATAAEIKARSEADVIAAGVRAQDVGTAERQLIIQTLQTMLGKVEAAKVTADTTQQLVVLANQQLTLGMDKTNRHKDSQMTTKQADVELAKHQATDKAVAEGAQAPAPVPPPEPTTPPLTVAVQTDEKVEIVSGNAVVITGASETPTAPVQPEVPKEGNL